MAADVVNDIHVHPGPNTVRVALQRPSISGSAGDNPYHSRQASSRGGTAEGAGQTAGTMR